MFYRECRKCGQPMDPEEGYGNVCDDCIQGEEERREVGADAQEEEGK